ncbi:CRISPR-associated endonuclease Cas3'' [Syntrophomonas erecta]
MVHIDDYLDLPCGEIIYAHEGETLVEHANVVMYFYHKLGQENGLHLQLEKIIATLRFQNQSLPLPERTMIRRWFEQAIYLHDLGKINPAYQRIKLSNNTIHFIDRETDHKHSLLSALLYLHLFLPETNKVSNDELRGFMRHVLFVFAYMISRHHTFLQHVSDKDDKFYVNLKGLLRRVTKQRNYIRYYRYRENLCANFELSLFKKYQRYDDEHELFSLYILAKLLYSTLVACDFYGTYTYTKNGQKPEFHYFSQQDISKLDSSYKGTELYQGIRAYKKDSEHFIANPINALRSDIFMDAENELLRNLDKNIFYLEAPTGSGKTNVSINLALRLLENDPGVNKIIYVFPFNTLVEQTKYSLDKVFPQEIQNDYRIQLINSITPIVNDLEKKEEEDFIDYQEEVLRRQMLQYPITVTSHVNFFNYLFGTGRGIKFSLYASVQ